MNFWIIAVALLVIPAAVISWPFFAGPTRERMLGIWVLVMMPLAGLLLYQQVGNPKAINQPTVTPQQQQTSQQPHDSRQPQMDEMVASLQKRMEENPDDPEGWVILGRTLKTMQRYAEAETALRNANRLLPDNALVMVELAEASLFASGSPQVSDEMRQLLEAALKIDPQQQKGLWLLGMAAAQDGDHAKAVSIWQQLLGLLDPASGAAQTVSQQIEMSREKGGLASAAQDEPVESFTGFELPVDITLADDLAGPLPANSILFVFMHPAGQKGMPLAVKRIPSPRFPLSTSFSNKDLLQPGTSLNEYPELDISARISMSGIANIASGDYQATTFKFDTNVVQEIALHIGQRVP
jgi:cytochrome c-type biogenesis protein CcmH